MNKKIERIAYISKITNICNVAFDDPKPLNSTVAINFLVNNHCTENSLTNSNPYLLKMRNTRWCVELWVFIWIILSLGSCDCRKDVSWRSLCDATVYSQHEV